MLITLLSIFLTKKFTEGSQKDVRRRKNAYLETVDVGQSTQYKHFHRLTAIRRQKHGQE